LWGHIRFGHDTLAAHGIVRADPYSFASDVPWINHEWLAEVITDVAYVAGGGFGLSVLKVLVIAATLGIVIRAWPATLPPRLRLWLIGAVLIGTIPQADHVRPQLFSLLLFATLLWLFVEPAGAFVTIVAVAILFAFWVNLHGGWIVGGGALAVWAAVALVRGRTTQERTRWLAAGIGAVLGTLVNPYGWRLWEFLWRTVGLGREQIADWQPVYVLGLPYVLIWVFIAGVSAALIVHHVRRRSIDVGGLTLVLLLAFAAFRVNRLLAFFAIASTMMLTRNWRAAAESRRTAVPTAVSLWIAGIAGAVILAGALVVSVVNLTCVRMDDPKYPEPEAAPAMAAAGLHGRMLTYFDWGEYAIWHLPNLSVSLDGRRETVYSDATVHDQVAMYFDPSHRRDVLQKLRPDYAWLPATLPLTAALKSDGWTPLYNGPRSVVLSARNEPPLSIPRVAGGRRCFPGP
jgi:hypothetical protein